MSVPRRLALALFVLGAVVDSVADPQPPRPSIESGGYFVMTADFHAHSFFGDGGLAPWLLVGEARRNGLDAIAITNHNRTWPARLARWLSSGSREPIVLVGQEVTTHDFHIAAVGIEQPVDWTHSAADAIDAVHSQGGIAIAAHPIRRFWPAYYRDALGKLDGAERAHPLIYSSATGDAELGTFFMRARAYQPALAAIGSSDFHVLGRPGVCRTYVFARERSKRGILEAVRAGRIVTYDQHGQPWGDASLFPLLASASGAQSVRTGVTGAFCAWLGLFGWVLTGPGNRRRLRHDDAPEVRAQVTDG
jgi:hypothetical protein